MATRAEFPTGVLFAGLGVLWGASFLLVKVGLQGLSPAQVGLARLVLGAGTLLVVVAVTGRRLPRSPRLLAHLLVVSVFLFVLPVGLSSWAGQFLPSHTSAVLNAATPLMTVLVASTALGTERASRGQLAGVLLGAAGMVVVTALWRPAPPGTPSAHWAVLAGLSATLSYALAYTWMRRHLHGPLIQDHDPVSLTAVELILAAAVHLAAAPLTGAFGSPVHLTPPVVLAVAVLGVCSTGIGYVWNATTTSRWGPLRASQVTYLTPVVGIALGALVLGEPLHWNEPVGTAVVLAGVLLTQHPTTQRSSAGTTTHASR